MLRPRGIDGRRMQTGRRRRVAPHVLLAAVMVVVASGGVAQGAARPASTPPVFPQIPPNDPSYPGQTYLFSTLPPSAPNATDPEGASGMSVDKAWQNFSIGRPDTVIAYVEGGVNWHNGDAAELADKMWLNWRELPVPCTGLPCTTVYGTSAQQYDVNHDGVFNVEDYAHDPRVHDANGNGVLDPEDLIAAFSDGIDHDHNGYVNDIAGWDFYNHQNDPATTDAAYGHANGQMKQAAAVTNNGIGGAGICPRCMIMPIKAGAEALDRTDDLAQAWQYAADNGASVIVSVTSDLGYSTFMRKTIDRLWQRGVIVVEASNDFDSTDHQGGMFWPHVVPGNGMVSDQTGGNLALTTTYRARSGLTSWGTHNMFTVPTLGGSTSESTPTLGGALALLLSYGKDAADQRLIQSPLTGPEAIQVLRATASNVADPTLPWPGHAGWGLQYGYGRPNVYKAMTAVAAGDIPPVVSIDSPDWYSLFDPTTTSVVKVAGEVTATRAPSVKWQLQVAPGPEPTDAQFVVAASGSGPVRANSSLGKIKLSTLPASFWTAAYALSSTKSLETTEQYTVTLRLQAMDASGRIGEDRRTIAVHHDPTLKSGFPLRIGPSGESQPALVDLQGQGRLDLVFGDADGQVHAIDPLTRRELPGWPVRTDPIVVDSTKGSPKGINPGSEPVLSTVSVGDLDHNGSLEVVVTSDRGKVYVFDAAGRRRPNWPQAMVDGVVAPSIPRPAWPHVRLPTQGALASPVLGDVAGTGTLDIVQAGWDGEIHVWRPDGSTLPGWPVRVQLPAGHVAPPGYFTVSDQKLEATPTIAELDGDNVPEVVIRSQYTDAQGGVAPGIAYLHAYHADGTSVAGWPVAMTTYAEDYGSAQEFITEGAGSPVAADVNGSGKDKVVAGGAFGPSYLIDGSGSIVATYGVAPGAFDVATTLTSSGAFGQFGGALAYVQSGMNGFTLLNALERPGSGGAILNVERAYGAATGTPLAGFPALHQGLDFLSAPVIADVVGDNHTEIVDGGDASTIHGYMASSTQASGFPKFDGGWTVGSPVTGDIFGTGHVDVATMTREGYLFVWTTPGLASANSEWWRWHHDEHNSGRYGVDTRPPGAIRQPHWSTSQATVTFTAPGNDWYDGTVAAYRVTLNPGGTVQSFPPSGPAGTVESIPVPLGTTSMTIQALDGAANLGPALALRRPTTTSSVEPGSFALLALLAACRGRRKRGRR